MDPNLTGHKVTVKTLLFLDPKITDGEIRLLLLKEAEGLFNTTSWHFPGGKLKPGETDIEALSREIKVETGLEHDQFRLFDPRPLFTFFWPAGPNWTSGIFYAAVADTDEVTINPAEHCEYSWNTAEEHLKRPDLIDLGDDIITQFMGYMDKRGVPQVL